MKSHSKARARAPGEAVLAAQIVAIGGRETTLAYRSVQIVRGSRHGLPISIAGLRVRRARK